MTSKVFDSRRHTDATDLQEIDAAMAQDQPLVLFVDVPEEQAEFRQYILIMLRELARGFDTMFKQNPKYGYSWRDDGLGARSMFSNATAKQFRLIQLLWKTPEGEWDLAKIIETIRDRMNYDLFCLVKLYLDHGAKISESAIQVEVDKT